MDSKALATLASIGLFALLCTSCYGKDKTYQEYIPDNFYYTSEYVYMLSTSQNNSLYDVSMHYDYTNDEVMRGTKNEW